MTEHNDIFNPQVRSFVFTVIDDVVRRALGETPKAARAVDEPPLIASPGHGLYRSHERNLEAYGCKVPLARNSPDSKPRLTSIGIVIHNYGFPGLCLKTPTMPQTIEHLFGNNKAWSERKHSEDPEFFTRLVDVVF